MRSPYYPDDLSIISYCAIEGCISNPCTRCGHTNYQELGYRGAVARWSKSWGITKEEAERRIEDKHEEETP